MISPENPCKVHLRFTILGLGLDEINVWCKLIRICRFIWFLFKKRYLDHLYEPVI